jgi:hypothetical protein
MTRRTVLLSTPAALLAQAPPGDPNPPQTSPSQSPPPLPQTPEEELKAALEQQRRAAEQLGAVKLPMSTEPACHFKP